EGAAVAAAASKAAARNAMRIVVLPGSAGRLASVRPLASGREASRYALAAEAGDEEAVQPAVVRQQARIGLQPPFGRGRQACRQFVGPDGIGRESDAARLLHAFFAFQRAD